MTFCSPPVSIRNLFDFFGIVCVCFFFHRLFYSHYGQMRYRVLCESARARTCQHMMITHQFQFGFYYFYSYCFSMSSLFSSASHDLKQPLLSMIGSSWSSTSCHLTVCVIYIYFVLIIFCVSPWFLEYCIRLAFFCTFFMFTLFTFDKVHNHGLNKNQCGFLLKKYEKRDTKKGICGLSLKFLSQLTSSRQTFLNINDICGHI